MTIDSKLTPQQIVDLSFKCTSSVLEETAAETKRWVSWNSEAVANAVQNAEENFYRERTDFRQLCSIIDDEPVKLLAFKKTEGLILAWKMSLDNYSWWSSSVASRVRDIQHMLQIEKNSFVKLCTS